jgi:ERCC4-type nuclease
LYQLELGDILFVALEDSVSAEERSSSKISKGRVLDYLIERKRNDDLASSLHDRRFSRQRYCMKQSNIGHLVYLIEGDLNAQEKENVDSLWQALMNTAMIDDFHIEYSKDVWVSLVAE